MTGAPSEPWKVDDLVKAWEANAEFVSRTNMPVQLWMTERLEPKAGQTVLELGAGPGDMGLDVAGELGGEGKLISTDISPQMVEVAKRRGAAAARPANIDFRVMDAQQIDLDDASVDGVIHRFGPMLLPDPDASFNGVRRVLREGGRYAAAVIGPPPNNPWISTPAMALMQNGVQMPGTPMDPGAPFSLSDADALRARIEGAGFSNVEVEPLDMSFDFPSSGEAWTVLTAMAGPIAMVIGGLDPEKREGVRSSFLEGVEQYCTDGGCSLPGQAICALAS